MTLVSYLEGQLTLATVAQATKEMNPRLAKNLTGIAGYFRFAYASYTKSATRRRNPSTIAVITAGDFHG